MTINPSWSRIAERRFTTLIRGLGIGLALIALTNSPAMGVAHSDAGPHHMTVSKAVLVPVNVPGTTPLAAAAVDLSQYGYSEREYYAEGSAHRYRGAVSNSLKTAEVIDAGWHYKTRVLVRTPRPGAFNGTLVVEWANVTVGQDIDFAWAESYDHLMRAGYAVAVVSAQRVGVEQLKRWSPARYGDLDVAADNTDPATNGPVDVCGMPNCTQVDPLSWDVMTQVAASLKANKAPAQPLPGRTVKRVLAMGESQSAGRLSTYYNAIQPLYGFFDGFVFLDRASQLRADLRTPAVSVDSEAWSTMFPAKTVGSSFVRHWEVAGSSHASLDAGTYVDRMVLRDQSIMGPSGPLSFSSAIGDCAIKPYFSAVNTKVVLNAAVESVNRWVTTGKPAAPSSYFDRAQAGSIARDSDGQVVGGVRLPSFTAPTSANHAGNIGAGLCFLVGAHVPYSADQLHDMYGTHRRYLKQVDAALKVAKQDGYVLPGDAWAIRSEAARSSVGS